MEINKLIVEAVDKLSTLRWEIGKIKDRAMDIEADRLASELNAIQNSIEVDENILKSILAKKP